MQLQPLYGPQLMAAVEKKRKNTWLASVLLTAVFLGAIALCIAMLYRYTLLCTLLCLGLALAAYAAVGILLGIRRQRLGAYSAFALDQQEGLGQEGVCTVLAVELPGPDPRYGLDMYPVKILWDGKERTVYVQGDGECPVKAGRRYYMQTVGDYPTAVGSYEH